MNQPVRNLGFRASPTRPDLQPLLRQFESLGVSCELGLIQRHCDVDQMGLCRFGMTPIDGLVKALKRKFARMSDPEAIMLYEGHDKEWMSIHADYQFHFHTERFANKVTESDMVKQLAVHLGFLARKLVEDLTLSEKIFVYRPEVASDVLESTPLVDALSHYGSPTLLWVDLAKDSADAGTCEWIIPGRLMRGYLDRYAPVRFAAGASMDSWVEILKAASQLQANRLASTRRTDKARVPV